ncbi:MAG: DNA cytosine methyltransferase, partial [Cyanobacteria bacterium P01_D01_bin.115]
MSIALASTTSIWNVIHLGLTIKLPLLRQLCSLPNSPVSYQSHVQSAAEQAFQIKWPILVRILLAARLRFVEYHRQPFVIVENVIEFADWELFDNWLGCFDKLGYQHQTVCFNSQFAYPSPVAQSRDRLYMVFHREDCPKPKVDFQPPGYCQHCQTETTFRQSWKNPLRRIGRYGKRHQYVYRCDSCGQEGIPFRKPAKDALDWSLPAVRIGDRQKPLSPN